MLSKGIKPSLLSSFVSPAFSTISRSMYLEKLRTTKPELKSRPFTYRHLGPNEKDISSMLSFLGMDSLTDLMQKFNFYGYISEEGNMQICQQAQASRVILIRPSPFNHDTPEVIKNKYSSYIVMFKFSKCISNSIQVI